MDHLITLQTDVFKNLVEDKEEFRTIAMTSTLRENLFILFVSLLNNVSSILVGPPGSSKTLCTRILYQAMRGPESKIEFFT